MCVCVCIHTITHRYILYESFHLPLSVVVTVPQKQASCVTLANLTCSSHLPIDSLSLSPSIACVSIRKEVDCVFWCGVDRFFVLAVLFHIYTHIHISPRSTSRCILWTCRVVRSQYDQQRVAAHTDTLTPSSSSSSSNSLTHSHLTTTTTTSNSSRKRRTT